MQFHLEQRFGHAPDRVAAAYADPALYGSLGGLRRLHPPEVLHHARDGDVVAMRIRYRFAGDLPAAARAVLDPARVSWIEDATHDLVRRTVEFVLRPDHYPDRLRCAGSYWFEPDGPGTVRHTTGELHVTAPLVRAAVERAIVSGLRDHQAEEAPAVDAFLSR